MVATTDSDAITTSFRGMGIQSFLGINCIRSLLLLVLHDQLLYHFLDEYSFGLVLVAANS
jgi:hypothetical protein